MDEIEATEMLLRAIMEQTDNAVRGILIQELCAKHSLVVIHERLEHLEQAGHITAGLRKTLQYKTLH